MKKSHSSNSYRSAFRAIYFLPVVAIVLFFVHYLIGTSQNDSPVKENVTTKPKADSVIQKSSREIEREVMLEPGPDLVTELASVKQVSIQNDDRGPLKELVPTGAQSQLLYEAEEALVQTCMNERGFEYITNSFDAETIQEGQGPILPKPGDIEAARTQGYGIAESIEMGQPINADSKESFNSDKEAAIKNSNNTNSQTDPNGELLANMSPEQQQAWNRAFFGRMDDNYGESTDVEGSIITVELPSGGKVQWDSNSCLSNARREIYDSSLKQMENQIATQTLVNNIVAVASQDAEYQAALEQWRNCMLSHGLIYQHPGEAANALHRQYSEGKLDIITLQKKEIRYASIEATCYQQYSVGDAYKTAEHRAETNIREAEAEQIDYLHAELKNALILAEKYAPHPGGE
ncbi:MAG: hypothetical protein ABW092_20510 [Candidatus Thiodiazotropha sp.]